MSDPTLSLAVIVAAAAVSLLIAVRVGIPGVVPLLAAGVVLGPFALDVFDPDALLGDLLEPFVTLAVGVILFDGAIHLRREELSEGVGRVVARLVSVGVLVTWGLAAVGAAFILGLSTQISILVGAVLTLSGPTVVLPLLDFVRPSQRVRTILKWEGILVDPIGAIIAVLTFEVVASSSAHFHKGAFAATIGVGVACGIIGALILLPVLRQRLTPALNATSTLAVVLIVTAAASAIKSDAGLVGAIVLGVTLAHLDPSVLEDTEAFGETLVTLLIGVLFVILSALVDPAAVVDLGAAGIGFVALLVLVARPLSVALCTAGSRTTRAERAFMAWMMPRGIVAASTVTAFQLTLVKRGIPDADKLVPVTFLVIIATVVIYGLTARWVAKALGVAAAEGTSSAETAPSSGTPS